MRLGKARLEPTEKSRPSLWLHGVMVVQNSDVLGLFAATELLPPAVKTEVVAAAEIPPTQAASDHCQAKGSLLDPVDATA